MKRRQVLKSGIAAALGASYFRGLSAHAAGDVPYPTRLIVLCKSNGSAQDEGNFRLPGGPINIPADSALTPLRAYQERINVVSGMTYRHMKAANFGCHLADPFVLSAKAATAKQGRWDGTGVSYYESTATATLDRFIAAQLGDTPLDSIAMRSDADKKGVLNHLSYESGPIGGKPNPSATADSLQAIWQTLFGAANAPAPSQGQARREAIDNLVTTRLHLAYESYRKRMASWQRQEVENHLAAVEKVASDRIKRAQQGSCEAPTKNLGTGINTPEEFDEMADTLVAAMRCNITRVATFKWMESKWTLPKDGMGPTKRGGPSDEHGDVGHTNDDKIIRSVDHWHMEQLKSLLDKLDAVPEGDGTMLDHSIVVFANRDASHQHHSHADLCWIVAGGGGGKLRGGQSLRWPSGQAKEYVSNARLLTTICQAMNVNPKGFSDEAPLPALLI